jgi:hypothetical protein
VIERNENSVCPVEPLADEVSQRAALNGREQTKGIQRH